MMTPSSKSPNLARRSKHKMRSVRRLSAVYSIRPIRYGSWQMVGEDVRWLSRFAAAVAELTFGTT
jgi:hypothetical protein